MMGEKGRLGSAQARWNDYVGTAAADDATALLHTRSLYELAGLDRAQWQIVGLDFTLGSSLAPVVVYALDHTQDWAGAMSADKVPVTAVHLAPSVPLDRFLAEAFERVTVRLVSSALRGEAVVVAAHAEQAELRAFSLTS